MAAKDLIHDPVRKALENDGWAITHEHMKVEFEDAYVNIELSALPKSASLTPTTRPSSIARSAQKPMR